MQLNALIAVADGSEEMETVIVADLLRRARFDVTIAACTPDHTTTITASRGVRLIADCHIDDVLATPFDVIVLPGGMPGAKHLGASQALMARLRQQRNHQRWIAAVCAAPAVVLAQHDLLGKGAVSCHPSVQAQIPPAQLSDESVSVDRDAALITAQGPGSCFQFALNIIRQLAGDTVAREVEAPLCLTEPHTVAA